MASQDTDQALVYAAQRGDKRAFDALVVKYQFKLLKLVERYVRDSAEASDIVQETFVRAYRALPSFQGKSAFYSWLYRIALNTAKNYLLANQRKPAMSVVDDLDALANVPGTHSDNGDPAGLLLRDEVEQAVWQAVDHLAEDLRTALVLREMAGLSYEEIADAVHCPIGTVRSRLFRAREAVLKEINPLLNRGGSQL